MKTISEYLYNLYRTQLPQLKGVAKASLDTLLNEITLYWHNGDIKCSASTPTLIVTATFYSEQDWAGQILPDSGSLKFKSCCREEFPSYPRELKVVFLAKPGKETQAILDILKECLK